MQRSSIPSVAASFTLSVAIAAPFASGAAQRSDLAVSPFVSFLPSAGTNPLAGLALTLAGDAGFGIRASAHLALENYNTAGFGTSDYFRPWGADADAILSLGGRGERRGLTPYAFAGIGTATSDSGAFRVTHSNWSFGAGLAIPLGSAIDVFGESRWRMSRYVLPTASLAPKPAQEIRAGLSLHFGMGGSRGSGRGARERAAESNPLLRLPTSLPAGTSSASAKRVLSTADDYVGAPYRYGGTSPTSGFDCSGFVQYVFAQAGVELPRTARQQAQVGQALAPDWRAVVAGDLVMFEENGRISHVAIYAGHNRIIHASASGGGVRYDDLGTERGSWFMDHMVAARRVTPDARGRLLDLAGGFSTNVELDGPDHAPRAR
ncbi:MAG: C40 family peptidase [Gemmatimonadaceae bacterium]